jgi:hypothetical protein
MAGTSIINVVKDYDWCLSQDRKDPDFIDRIPAIELKAFSVTGNQQLTYLSKILGKSSFEGAIKNAFTTRATNALNVMKETVNPGSGAGVSGDPYTGLYDLKDENLTIRLPYFVETPLDASSSWSEKIVEDAKSLYGSALELSADIAAKLGNQATVALGLSGIPSLFEDKGIDQLTKSIIKQQAGVKAPYSGTEQPMYFNGTDRSTVAVTFPLYNIFDGGSVRSNIDLINRMLYWSVKDRTSFFAYESPYVFSVRDTSEVSAFYSRPLMFINNITVKNLGVQRRVQLSEDSTWYTLPEAYQVTISLTEMITLSRNVLQASWDNVPLITARAPQNSLTISLAEKIFGTTAPSNQTGTSNSSTLNRNGIAAPPSKIPPPLKNPQTGYVMPRIMQAAKMGTGSTR